MKNFAILPIIAAAIMLTGSVASVEAAVVCKTVGVPKGCVAARPVAARPVVVAPVAAAPVVVAPVVAPRRAVRRAVIVR